jgi:large subunit ribosomal protein L10
MRPEKASIYAEIRQKVSESPFLILADYQGLSVLKMQDLQRRLRGANARIQVVKNRMLRHVADEVGVRGLAPSLAGPSAMVYGRGDVVQVAKVLKDFIKENEKPKIKAGSMQGSLLTARDVDSLASLPSREVLLAMAVGTIAAPMAQLVGVLDRKVASLVYALKAVADKKSKSEQPSNA